MVISSIVKHWNSNNLNYNMIIYITLCHLGGIVGLFRLKYASQYTLLWAYCLWNITGLGITAGAHRLWSHKSYIACKSVRCFLMITNSIANQGSIYHWVRDHRVHHKASETNGDPHNASRGFFFAHMGWLFLKKHSDVKEIGSKISMADMEEDGFVMFQKYYDPWFNLCMCFLVPPLIATLGWNEHFWNALWITGFLRYVIVLHCTWMVNSAAHIYGDHPYDKNIKPAENPIVSFLAIGEGWHNWHHKYPYDYSTSEFGITSQFNPTKLFIDTCCYLKLASGRKRALGAWERAKEKRS